MVEPWLTSDGLMQMVPKHWRCSRSLRTGETQVRDAVRGAVYIQYLHDRGLAGPQQRLSEVLSFTLLWRRWQRPPRVCTRVLEQGVTRGLPRVCVSAPVCHTWVCGSGRCPRVCACVSVYSSASRLGALRARGLHTMCLQPRMPGATRKVFAFQGGRGRAGHTSLPPPGEDYCSENENQANSSGHLLLFGSRIA